MHRVKKERVTRRPDERRKSEKDMKATYKTIEGLTRRQIVNAALKAMTAICGYDNGTLRNPSELASSVLRDGRYLIQAINEDGEILYNDGWYIVEVTESHLYVDITTFAYKEEFGQAALDELLNGGKSLYKTIGNLA